jgi:hypothetical protein
VALVIVENAYVHDSPEVGEAGDNVTPIDADIEQWCQQCESEVPSAICANEAKDLG